MNILPFNIEIDHSLQKVKSLIEGELQNSQLFILTDSNTKALCLPVLQNLSPQFKKATIIEIPAGEINKSKEYLFEIFTQLLSFEANKSSVLINLGGGVVLDIGGFAASIYKRGIKFYHIPTSLLAQLDASIGGKNGIDFLGLKNVLGTITFPEGIFISKIFLNTLPEIEWRNGIAEALKHGLIADVDYWNAIKKDPLKNVDLLLEKSIEIKTAIVINDPVEKNIRKKLNAGHTIGHAIEAHKLENGESISHGEAVAAGLIMESYLSMQLGYLLPKEFDEIEEVINALFGKINIETLSIENIMDKMKQDKKNNSHKISFSFIRSIGNATYNDYCDNILVKNAIEYYINA